MTTYPLAAAHSAHLLPLTPPQLYADVQPVSGNYQSVTFTTTSKETFSSGPRDSTTSSPCQDMKRVGRKPKDAHTIGRAGGTETECMGNGASPTQLPKYSKVPVLRDQELWPNTLVYYRMRGLAGPKGAVSKRSMARTFTIGRT